MNIDRRLARLENAIGGTLAPTDAEFADTMRRQDMRADFRLWPLMQSGGYDRLQSVRDEYELAKRFAATDTPEAEARDAATIRAWYRANRRDYDAELAKIAEKSREDAEYFRSLRREYVPSAANATRRANDADGDAR